MRESFEGTHFISVGLPPFTYMDPSTLFEDPSADDVLTVLYHGERCVYCVVPLRAVWANREAR